MVTSMNNLNRIPRVYRVNRSSGLGSSKPGTSHPPLRLLQSAWITRRLLNWNCCGLKGSETRTTNNKFPGLTTCGSASYIKPRTLVNMSSDIPRTHSTILSSVDERFSRALDAGDLFFYPSSTHVHDEAGIEVSLPQWTLMPMKQVMSMYPWFCVLRPLVPNTAVSSVAEETIVTHSTIHSWSIFYNR